MDKDTEKMLETIHNNHLKEAKEYQEEEDLKSKQKKGNKLVNLVLVGIGILIFGLILWLMRISDNNFIEDCQKAGYSQSYCEIQLDK